MRHACALAALALLPMAPLACGARTSLGVGLEEDAAVVDGAHDAAPKLDSGVDAAKDVAPDVAPDVTGDGAADVAPDSPPDSGTGLLTLSVVGVSADRVSAADQGIYPDGQQDGYFAATAVGAFDGLILVTTSNVSPAFGQQWDTLFLQDPIPQLGFSFSSGDQTWVLGVWENNQLVSDSACRVSLSPGAHVLQLVGSSSGYFHSGVEYRLYGRLGGTWIQSNVAVWP